MASKLDIPVASNPVKADEALFKGMTSMLRKLEMTERRQAEALEETRRQIDSCRAVIAGLA